MMWRLANPVMDYDWGSMTDIPDFLGEEPDGRPQAEMWFGAHPKAPSVLMDFDGEDVALDEAIVAHPELLGEPAVDLYGARLPFLVKLLAAGKPLSLQVHPDEAMAAEGYAREEAAGVALDDAMRTYKDQHHKPEVMLALAPTQTLAGFRPAKEAQRLLNRLAEPWAERIAELVDDGDMRPALEQLLDADAWVEHGAAVLGRCAELAHEANALAWVGLLAKHFPGDSGAAAPLLLNDVSYGPGEGLFVPVGQLHAHVGGFGVEVMAASDNVIRAGLTPKHVDRAALMAAIRPSSEHPSLMQVGDVVAPPVGEFRVTVCRTGDGLHGAGPKIALAMSDGVVGGLRLARGEAVFVADGERPVVERGEVWVTGLA